MKSNSYKTSYTLQGKKVIFQLGWTTESLGLIKIQIPRSHSAELVSQWDWSGAQEAAVQCQTMISAGRLFLSPCSDHSGSNMVHASQFIPRGMAEDPEKSCGRDCLREAPCWAHLRSRETVSQSRVVAWADRNERGNSLALQGRTCWKVVAEPRKILGFLASGGEFNLGPEMKLDHSELLCNRVLLKYKRDRESVWHRHQKEAERVPHC